MTPSILQRFLDKVHPEPNSGCWLWTGSAHSFGYGFFHMEGKTQRAHRVSFQLHCGPIESGMCVLHECDNPYCVNPDHLRLGTQADNVHDCVKKGRASYPLSGPAPRCLKLTAEKVREIRQKRNDGATTKQLAVAYNVDRSMIRRICKGVVWKNV